MFTTTFGVGTTTFTVGTVTTYGIVTDTESSLSTNDSSSVSV